MRTLRERVGLITGNGYTVYALRESIDPAGSPVIPIDGGIIYRGGTYRPPAAGQLLNDQTSVPHYPWVRVYGAIQDVVQHPQHRGGCRPIRRVRPVFGGGFVEGGEGWLIEGEPVAWIHDERFHHGCPEEDR